jgi:hypothetical protein
MCVFSFVIGKADYSTKPIIVTLLPAGRGENGLFQVWARNTLNESLPFRPKNSM